MDVRKYARANFNIPASSLSSCYSCSSTPKHGKARLAGNYTAGMFIVVFISIIQHSTVQGCCHDAWMAHLQVNLSSRCSANKCKSMRQLSFILAMQIINMTVQSRDFFRRCRAQRTLSCSYADCGGIRYTSHHSQGFSVWVQARLDLPLLQTGTDVLPPNNQPASIHL